MSTFGSSNPKAIKETWTKLHPAQQAEAWRLMMAQVATAQLVELTLEQGANQIRADLRHLPKPL